MCTCCNGLIFLDGSTGRYIAYIHIVSSESDNYTRKHVEMTRIKHDQELRTYERPACFGLWQHRRSAISVNAKERFFHNLSLPLHLGSR
jgi:hypothetical protein